jgi:glucose-6-phosphate dehydrogenase assembly protein OpcA
VSIPASKLEHFSAGQSFAVDPSAIERELASLWRAAGASNDGAGAVMRACLWNVVVHLEERPKFEGHSEIDSLTKLVRDLPQYLAARSLVLKTLPEEQDAPELESWISANCILSGSGGKLVCSEEVAIAARGDGERHLPALVRALLVPAVPTAIVFGGVGPVDRDAFDDLLETASRVVVHADRSTLRAPLERVCAMCHELPLGGIDLGWIAHSSHRALIASLFDAPATPKDAEAIDRVVITTPRSLRCSAQLMSAWMAGALQGTNPQSIGNFAWHFQRPEQRTLEMAVVEDAKAERMSFELFASSQKARYRVTPVQDNLAEVTGPNLETKKILAKRTLPQLLARALRTRAEDRAFLRALELAKVMR